MEAGERYGKTKRWNIMIQYDTICYQQLQIAKHSFSPIVEDKHNTDAQYFPNT